MGENIAENTIRLMARTKPEKHIKYKESTEGINRLTKEKKKKEKDYEYYFCDYCHDEIRILDNQKNVDGNVIASGGIVDLPQTLTRTDKKIRLALCNKCLRPVVQQFTDKNMLKDNENHIPRIDWEGELNNDNCKSKKRSNKFW